MQALQDETLISKEPAQLSFCRQSQLKQSQILGPCCSRHLRCLELGRHSPQPEDSFSVDSELLQQVQIKDISTEAIFQYGSKPEIDMLAKINIKKKQFQKVIQQHQAQQDQLRRQQLVQKVNAEAKQALEKSKKVSQTQKARWGHSTYELKPQSDKANKQVQVKEKPQEDKQQKEAKKVELKPIHERIAQYQQRQLARVRSAGDIKKTVREDLNTEDCHQKVRQNAQKIMEQMKEQKEKALEQKRIIQAKIRALQIQSLQKAANSKKKPLGQQPDFLLGDSQYSTFQARAQGRKTEKKKKKGQFENLQGPAPVKKVPSSGRSSSGKLVSGKSRSSQKQNKGRQMPGQEELKIEKEEQKGPFFIWNIPILPQDVQKLERPSKDIFMNVDRFNYKQGKTFREEANQFLAKKNQSKMEQAIQETKEQSFWRQVEMKKRTLQAEFAAESGLAGETAQAIEPFWNEDELFRGSLLENFHFCRE